MLNRLLPRRLVDLGWNAFLLGFSGVWGLQGCRSGGAGDGAGGWESDWKGYGGKGCGCVNRFSIMRWAGWLYFPSQMQLEPIQKPTPSGKKRRFINNHIETSTIRFVHRRKDWLDIAVPPINLPDGVPTLKTIFPPVDQFNIGRDTPLTSPSYHKYHFTNETSHTDRTFPFDTTFPKEREVIQKRNSDRLGESIPIFIKRILGIPR